MFLSLCRCDVWTKERRKRKRIESWLVHGATHKRATQTFFFSSLQPSASFFRYSIRWFIALHIQRRRRSVVQSCCVFYNKGYHIEWLVVFRFSFCLLCTRLGTKPILLNALACLCALRASISNFFLCFLWLFCCLQY